MKEKTENSNEPLISIVIQTFNRKNILTLLLESIFNSNYNKEKIQVIVVDDASTDGTSDEIKNKFSSVQVIRNQKELLASHSRNIGAKSTKGEFIFFIDDDNVIDKNCIKELVKILQSDDKIGNVGPLMYYFSEKNRIAWAGAKRGKLTSLTKVFDTMPEQSIVETDYIPNAIMTRKKIAEKVCYFDIVNFPFQYDDGDFSQRIKEQGYKIVFTKNSKVWHDISLPENVKEKTRSHHCNSEKMAYHSSKSRILYQFKYTSKVEFLIFILFFNWILSLYYLKIILFNSKRPFKEKCKIGISYLKGIRAGLKMI